MGFTFPKNYQTLSAEEKSEWIKLKGIFSQLGKEYYISKGKRPVLSNFLMIREKETPILILPYKVKKGLSEFTLCLITYKTKYNELSVRGGTIRTDSHKYLVGYVSGSKDFGRAYLRPETFGDKISEFFEPIELDIKGFEKFNREYYLLSNDKQKFLQAISPELLKYLAELKNLEMEFNGS